MPAPRTKPTRSLVIAPPDENAPGYLRRQRRLLHFQQAANEGRFTLSVLDDMIEFILDFVVEPHDRVEARTILEDLSEREFIDIINQLAKGNDTPPLG